MKNISLLSYLMILLLVISSCKEESHAKKIQGFWVLEKLSSKGVVIYDIDDIPNLIAKKLEGFPTMNVEDSAFVKKTIQQNFERIGKSSIQFTDKKAISTYYREDNKVVRNGTYELDPVKLTLSIYEKTIQADAVVYDYSLMNDDILVMTDKTDQIEMIYRKKPANEFK